VLIANNMSEQINVLNVTIVLREFLREKALVLATDDIKFIQKSYDSMTVFEGFQDGIGSETHSSTEYQAVII